MLMSSGMSALRAVNLSGRRIWGPFILPWPHILMAVWVGILLVGGARAAKVGPGPIYPNEIVFAVAFAALLLRPKLRRDRIAAIRTFPLPRLFQATILVYAFAFAIALVRGGYGYGRGALHDAGLGYVLLVPLIAFAFVGRSAWLNGFMRVLFWASVVTVPVLVLEYTNDNTIAPLSLSIGFVLLFSLAPMLDDWLNGVLPWIGRLYVIAVPVFVFWKVASRSAIGSLVIGLLIVVALNLRGSRRIAVAGGAVVGLAVVGIGLYLIAPGVLDKVPPVRLAESTLNLSPNTKGNNARWRLDYAGALLHRSVESPRDALLGVGLGKPSEFLWHENAAIVQAYDFRGRPIPKHVVANGDVSGPHNGFADVVYRLGWPAGLALVGILLFGMRIGARARRLAPERDARSTRALLAVTAAGIFVALTSDALRVPECAVPFACAIGLLAAYGLTTGRGVTSTAHRLPRDTRR